MADGKETNTPLQQAGSKNQDLQSRDLEERRRKLEVELTQKGALNKPEDETDGEEVPSSIGQAIKLSSEFLAAVVVGVVLGLGADQVLGTKPWGMIVFLLLGFAAGVLNVLRAVGLAEQSTIGKKSALRKEDDKADKP